MKSIEQLANLSPGGIDPEPRIASTAPRAGLSGVEVAATLAGLARLEELIMWVKYIGEAGMLGALELEYFAALDSNRVIRAWLNQETLNKTMRAKRRENYKAIRRFLLRNHLSDYRCRVCRGAGSLYSIECEWCAGEGIEKLSMYSVAQQTGVDRVWCHRARAQIVEMRAVLITAENNAIASVVENDQ